MRDREIEKNGTEEETQLNAEDNVKCIYSGNLTCNLICEPPKVTGNGRIHLEDMEFPCEYDSFIINCADTYIDKKNRFAYRENSSRRNLMQIYRRGDRKVSFEYSVCSDRENVTWLRQTVLLVKNNQDILAVTCLEDITEEMVREQRIRETLEKMEVANLEKSEFINRMSHDIRTPMNAIIGMTDIAAANIDDKERIRDCLDKIAMSSNHLLALVNEILDISRIESGKQQMRECRLNLRELLNHIADMIRLQSNRKHQSLSVKIRQMKHERVWGDELKIKEMLMNIMGNAVKYTESGGDILVRLSEREVETEEFACYEFSVKDNGIGMDEEFLKHIFDPFTRGENVNMHIPGAGLGMTIARKIAQMMNGDIYVKSMPGQGSEFTIMIYLKYCIDEMDLYKDCMEPIAAGIEPCMETSAALGKSDFSDKRVLIVEDNILNLEIESEIISTTGANVETAENGKIAVEMIESSEQGYYDLVFMDIRMPKMDGYEATARIRELDREDTKRVPIVAMTANAFADDAAMSRRAGMNDHVIKPLDISRLFATMEKWLPQKNKH